MSLPRSLVAVSLACLIPDLALAGGLDRTGNTTGLIFEKGNLAEFSYARAMPTIQANPNLFGDIANDYNMLSYSVKMDLDPKWSLGLQVSQPYGIDVGFNLGASGGETFVVGGAVRSASTSAILRYKFSENFAIHGGIYDTTIGGSLTVSEPIDLGAASGQGVILGASAEVPKIAARIALTWFSGTSHGIVDGLGTIDLPQTVNLDFQTGVAANTLLFGSVRWGEWSKGRISALGLPLISWRDNSYDYSLGLGRRFNDNWSGAILWSLSPKSGNDTAYSFSPTNGSESFGIAAVYTKDRWKISAGIQTVNLGDNRTLEPLISWKGNSALGAGLKIAYSF